MPKTTVTPSVRREPATSSAERTKASTEPGTSPAEPATTTTASKPKTDVHPEAAADEPVDGGVIKTGNKVKPSVTESTKRPKPGGGSWGIFGQVADAIAKGLVGGHTAARTPAAPAANTDAEGTASDDAGVG